MELKKELGGLDLFAIATGAMISSGLFVLPGVAYSVVGPGIFISYFLASILLLPMLFNLAELGTAIPKAGGEYYFISRSFGPGIGTLGGVATWAVLSFKTAFALIGMGAFANVIWPSLSYVELKLVAFLSCVFFTGLNLWGSKHSGRMQRWLVGVLLLILGVYIVYGLFNVNMDHFKGGLFRNSDDQGNFSLLAVGAAMVFISYAGIGKITIVAEEVKDPGKTLWRAMFAAFIIASVIYVVAVFVTIGIVPRADLLPLPEGVGVLSEAALMPFSAAGAILFGQIGRFVMAGGALLAFASTANAGIMTASRSPMAMSRDGLLPPFFSRINTSHGTPHYAILITSGFISMLLFLPITIFVKSASAMILMLYWMSNLCVILMRESKLKGYQPKFRAPLYPWMQVTGLLAYAFLLRELGALPLFIAGGILACAVVWYALYAHPHIERESALTHLARRIAGMAFPSHDLEAELGDIIHEREGAVGDRFDRLVSNCRVIDLPPDITKDKLFRLAAGELCGRLNVPADEIYCRLHEREELGSTVVIPGLAIPHVVVDGTGLLDLVIFRSEKGIDFSEETLPVHAVFVLAGSNDERNSHLRALMAIAEIAQHEDFSEKWLSAADEEALRSLVINSKRHREPSQT